MRKIFGVVLASSLILASGARGQESPAADVPAAEAPSYPTLRIGGFTDINFFATDQEGVDSNSGFSEGQFVLHFGSVLAPKLTFFGEVSLTARASSFNAVVERAIIKYDFGDAAKLSFGRYHTPINWWNNAYHHGQWLQTTISRPEMTKFGGRFVPVHFVGGLLEGVNPAGGMNLSYKAGVGNGRGNDPSQAGDAGDSNNNRAWLLTADLRPDALYEMEVGAAFYNDKITFAETATTPKSEYLEKIVSAHFVWHSETPEVIAEWTRSSHEAETGPRRWDNDAWYVLVAYRLPGSFERWKPYVRYEDVDIDEGDPTDGRLRLLSAGSPFGPDHDPVYGGLADREEAILGLRWDFTDTLAVKGEYRRTTTGTQKDVHGAYLQICYAF